VLDPPLLEIGSLGVAGAIGSTVAGLSGVGIDISEP